MKWFRDLIRKLLNRDAGADLRTGLTVLAAISAVLTKWVGDLDGAKDPTFSALLATIGLSIIGRSKFFNGNGGN